MSIWPAIMSGETVYGADLASHHRKDSVLGVLGSTHYYPSVVQDVSCFSASFAAVPGDERRGFPF